MIDIVWRLNSPEALAEMTSIAEMSAAKGNARAVARMGKMYYYGRGYEKDLDEAERLAREALKSGVPWARSIINKVEKKRADAQDSSSEE
jgi:TPR repeat protein